KRESDDTELHDVFSLRRGPSAAVAVSPNPNALQRQASTSSSQQLLQLLGSELLHERWVVVGDDVAGEPPFALDQLVDFLFDAAARDQLDHLHAFVLAEAVNAVGGLIFAGLVPPSVVVTDDGRAGEVDAQTAGAETRGEDAAFGSV